MAVNFPIYYVCCKFNIVITTAHIPGLENSPTYALSRLHVGRFRALVPHAAALPTPVPLLDLASFKSERNTISIRVSHPQLTTPQAAQAQYESLIINACGILLRNPENGLELKVLKWKLGKRFKKINTRRISNKKCLTLLS